MKQSLFVWLFVFMLTSIKCGVGEADQSIESLDAESAPIIKLSNIYVDGLLKFFPELSSFYDLDNSDHSVLSDNSLSGYAGWLAFEDSVYAEFTKFPENYAVGSEAWYFYGILKEVLESSIELRVCRPELMKINHLHGWHISLVNLVRLQPIGTEDARKAALKCWSHIGQYVNNEIINLRTGIKLGYTVPKDIVAIVIEQLDNLLKEPTEKSGFYSPASRDSNEIFRQAWKDLIKSDIYPAIKKYRDFLRNEYYAKTRESISISALPEGDKCFEAYFRAQTSLKRSAREIYDISEYRVKVNDSKLRIRGKKIYGTDSIPLIIKKIQSDTAQYFNSKEEILAFIKESIKKAKQKCSSSFYKLPSTKIKVVAIPEKSERLQSSYYIPSIDNTDKPSVYYVNLRNPKKRLKENVETEIFHETFPGHHLQIGLTNERESSSLFTKLFSVMGYVEGWASYAQILAEELDLYSIEHSSLIVLGKSSRLMYVEAGIHTRNWSRKQAVKYLLNTIVRSEDAANQIINRAIAWPGQFSTYDTGLMEILELREQAILTLGDRFDIREFHAIILEGGAIPLEMLREKVNWWLERKKQE